MLVMISLTSEAKLDENRYAAKSLTAGKCAIEVIKMKIRERGFGNGVIKLQVELDERETERMYDAYEAYSEQNKKALLFFDFQGSLPDDGFKIKGSMGIYAQKISPESVECRLARHNQLPYIGQRSFKLIDTQHGQEMD